MSVVYGGWEKEFMFYDMVIFISLFYCCSGIMFNIWFILFFSYFYINS